MDTTTASHDAWESIAQWWDTTIGPEGNRFHRLLIEPATLELLQPVAGELMLEIACGNGAFARALASRGVRVLATDFSRKFLERAVEHSAEYLDSIDYRFLDATDESQFAAFTEKSFDAVICTMALMDIAEIDPLMRGVRRILKPQGRFVFSVCHPCFNTNGSRMSAEMEDRDGELVETFSVKVSRYITSWVEHGIGIPGQPAPHFYFNRPLGELLGSGFRAGLVLDGLKEPIYPGTVQADRWASWANFREIPPALIGRFRPWGTPGV